MYTNNYYKKYLKYKEKYLNLKKIKIQNGGADEEENIEDSNPDFDIQNQNDDTRIINENEETKNINDNKNDNTINIDNLEYQINKHINNLSYMVNQILSLITSYKQNKDEIVKQNLDMSINKLIKYLENNDIPLDYYNLNSYDIDDLENMLGKLKSELFLENLDKLYKLRSHIYTLNEINYPEVLDYIINKFLIANAYDVEKLFKTSLLGFNKNYIIGYMVLLRLLVKNKFQLSLFDENITYLTFFSLWTSLNNQNNLDEYIPIITKLINEYIFAFPIKKVLLIKSPAEIEKSKTLRFSENYLEIPKLEKYDVKNKILVYESGETKSIDRINYDDIKQILYNLFRIRKFS